MLVFLVVFWAQSTVVFQLSGFHCNLSSLGLIEKPTPPLGIERRTPSRLLLVLVISLKDLSRLSSRPPLSPCKTSSSTRNLKRGPAKKAVVFEKNPCQLPWLVLSSGPPSTPWPRVRSTLFHRTLLRRPPGTPKPPAYLGAIGGHRGHWRGVSWRGLLSNWKPVQLYFRGVELIDTYG